jgi:hypothetical protein
MNHRRQATETAGLMGADGTLLETEDERNTCCRALEALMDVPGKTADDGIEARQLRCKVAEQGLKHLTVYEAEMIREGISVLLQLGCADDASELIPLYDKLEPRTKD